ncbi:malonyl-CoA synthase [Gemmobacter aquarius]|uniref:Malonyl-CoA synthase n=1 Tax=Paragemmobacter aquarius TaxID=2169400 RepID=A0A2S0UI44_9RHOB|nr:malonyl-CoA synthase [Gemmobacter aquarius]AWB47507.1 malonyl-CoA synthase [Gemmobacter aquarius]
MANLVFDRLFAPLRGRQGAVLLLADGREVSGDALYRMIARQANALAGLGVVKGDRIAVQVAKSPEALALYGAAVALGAVFLPLNTAYTAAEVGYFLDDAQPRVFVCDGGRALGLAGVAGLHGAEVLTLDADGSGTLRDLAEGAAEAVTLAGCGAGDLAALLYTSGTTGRSKGAMLSHGNLLSNAEVLVHEWRFTQRDVLLHALPVFHTHGLFVATNVALLSGARMIWLAGFDAGQVMAHLPAATVLMGVPTFYTRLLDDAGLSRGAAAHMRLFVSGSAPLLAETHMEWEARTGHRILERYGMTETNMNTSNPYDGERRAGTVGLPLPGVELRIMADGAEVSVGEVGVIEVRGPNVFQGYWRMPEKTAEELRPDGWFITGDLGMRDGEGYVSIVGRAKDLVITGGYNVYPKEVELLLDAVPGVLESAVIGVPHRDFGEAVFAVLVAQKGVALEAGAVLAAVAGDLARFKQPKAAAVVDSLPRNTMGKVQKNILRETYRGWFG